VLAAVSLVRTDPLRLAAGAWQRTRERFPLPVVDGAEQRTS
jgi:hypothetical protein